MSAVTLREITAENWRATLALAVAPEQQRFVADHAPIAAIVLAKAYVRPGGLDWTPYGIYAAQEVIGMLALAREPGGAGRCWLFHFFIDRRYQGRGYGTRALQAVVELVTARYPECARLNLTVHPDNLAAQKLYAGCGFRPTGQLRDGEPVYTLPLAGGAAQLLHTTQPCQ